MNRRIDASSRRSGIVSIVLGGAWALALIAFAAELEWAIAPLRILFSVASLLLSYLFIMSGAAILVVSPLFLLALVAGWGFSIVPALFCAAEYALSGTNYYPRLPEFVGSSAELLILEFALYCLLITLLVSRYWEKTPELGSTIPLRQGLWLLGGVTAPLALIQLFAIAGGFNSTLRSWLIGRDLLDSLPYLFSALVITAALATVQQRTKPAWLVLAFCCMAIAVTLFLAGGNTKITFLCVCTTMLWMLTQFEWQWRRLRTVSLVVIALVVGLAGFNLLKFFNPDRFFLSIAYAPVYKLVYRQADTGLCLVPVIETHLRDLSSEGTPSLLFMGLWPRYLWPAKPNLSSGDEWAIRYCGYPETAVRQSRHSASVTLLGDPIIFDGWRGLALAHLTIALVLAAATFLLWRRYPFGQTVVLAMMPWLIDFDQHFPLYLAQVGKGLLYVGCAVGAVMWLSQRKSARR